jgi:tetratricopeptide (TPR) repeat protein
MAQPQGGIQSSNASRNGAMFRGQKLKMPTLPFGRQTTTPYQASRRVPQSNAPAASPYNAARSQSHVSAQVQAGRPVQQRMPAGNPALANANRQTARVADGRPPQPIRQDQVPQLGSRPTARAAQSAPNATSVSPWTVTPAAAQTAKPNASAATKPAAPLSTADRLVAGAHELSTRAQSEQEFTQIIETCRRAQASQASPATAQYAKNLIAWSLNRRGQLKAEAGQDKEAMLDFDDAIRTDAGCWRALHNRGVLSAQAGQFAKAFDDFSRTIQLNPQVAKAYSNRAALFMVANNLNAALQDYNRAIETDPNLAVAHRGFGRACQLTGRMEDAIVHYDAAVQLAPTDAYAAACRADLLTDVGRYSEAAAEYNRAIDIDSKSTQAQSGLAWLLATCPDSTVRNPDLAIQRAQTVIELGGEKDAVNFDTLAAAQANAGNFDAAMDSARKAIELAPADERDAYKDRLLMYQQAKPYRIAPIEREVQQVSYETAGGVEGVAR